MFDKEGRPQDVRPGQKLRREGIGMTSGRGRPKPSRHQRKRPSEGGRENSDDSSYSGDKEDGGGSDPPMDEEEEVKGVTHIEGAARRPSTRQTPSARNYNIPYQ